MTRTLDSAATVLAYQPLPQDIRDGLATMLGWAGWIAAVIAIGRLIYVAASLWLKPDQNEGGGGVIRVILACIIIGAGGLIAGALLTPP